MVLWVSEPARDVASPVEVETLTAAEWLVVAAAGEIDIATATEVRGAIDRAFAAGAVAICVDLSRVEFMDSTGLRVLLDGRSAATARGARFAVVCPPGPVMRVFEVAGVAPSFVLHRDRASAVAG